MPTIEASHITVSFVDRMNAVRLLTFFVSRSDVKDDDTIIFLRQRGEDTTGAAEDATASSMQGRQAGATTRQMQSPFNGMGKEYSVGPLSA